MITNGATVGDEITIFACDMCVQGCGKRSKIPPDSGCKSWMCDKCGHYGIGSYVKAIIGRWGILKIRQGQLMNRQDAISLHYKSYADKFPVMVWDESGVLVAQVDGKVYRHPNMFALDNLMDAGGVPRPRNLYFIDEPCYED